jgi:GMP synthase (glutamine-hydrolysing)
MAHSNMKTFLLLQLRPEKETADNEYEAFMRFGGLGEHEITRVRADKGLPDIDLTKHAAILVGGSPYDVSLPNEEKGDDQKRVEAGFKELFDRVVPNDFPFLGACSGNGLLGSYCGAQITRTYAEPVGGVDITITEEGREDPLLSGLPKTFRALVGHKEACEDTPPGAVLLASAPTCPVQMFRLGKNVYATQFHPEADGTVFVVRINVYKHHGYFPPEEAEALIARVQDEKTPVANTLLKRFVERYRTS